MNYVISLSLLCILACQSNPNCPRGSHPAITIVNRSSKNIYYEIYWNYPDTVIGQYNPVHSNDLLKPGDKSARTVSSVRTYSSGGTNSC